MERKIYNKIIQGRAEKQVMEMIAEIYFILSNQNNRITALENKPNLFKKLKTLITKNGIGRKDISESPGS